MEHDRPNDIRVLATQLAVGILADVEIQRRVETRTSPRGREADYGELGDAQYFRNIADEVLGCWGGTRTVVDVVKTAVVGCREDGAAGAVDAAFCQRGGQIGSQYVMYTTLGSEELVDIQTSSPGSEVAWVVGSSAARATAFTMVKSDRCAMLLT